MPRRLHDCSRCACLIVVEDQACPFCGAPQHHVTAPLWVTAALVGGVGLAGLACDERERPTEFRFGTSTGTTGGSTTTGETSTSSTSVGSTGSGTSLDPESDSFPDGSTYGGPDETTRTDSGPPATSSSSDSSTGQQPDPGASTYAGPDEFTTIFPTTDLPEATLSETNDDSGPSEGGGSDTSDDADTTAATGEGQQPLKDGCACNSDARPPGALLGLFALAVRRRRLTARRR